MNDEKGRKTIGVEGTSRWRLHAYFMSKDDPNLRQYLGRHKPQYSMLLPRPNGKAPGPQGPATVVFYAPTASTQ